MKSNGLSLVSLFSGCGGLDLGFKNAGYEIKWANEFDEKIWETYELNHQGTELNKNSIEDILSNDIPECNGILGGPPCQSWSLAGSMGGIEDNRGKLFYEYARVLRDKQPEFFLAENVPGIISSSHIKEFKKILSLFSKIGYNVNYKKLNSVNYGVPQTRQRVFIVGFRKDLNITFKFPAITHVWEKENNNKKKLKLCETDTKLAKTLKDAIGDLPEPMPAENKNYSNGEKLKINAHEYYIGEFSSRFMSRNRRRGWDEPAYTIQANGRHARIHPSAPPMIKVEKDNWKFNEEHLDKYRRLSVRESARIQTFPDDFKFVYNKVNNGYKMVGNAVPVKLAEALAKEIKMQLAGTKYYSKELVSF